MKLFHKQGGGINWISYMIYDISLIQKCIYYEILIQNFDRISEYMQF